MAFAHLHNRTGLSLLDGAWTPEELAKKAGSFGMPAVAITDTCNLYGAVEFYKACKGANTAPVFGASLWMWPDGLANLDPRKPDGGWDLVLLIEDKEGYKSLCQLITTAIFTGMHYRPRIDWALLERYKSGLIALTSGLNGPLAQAVREGAEGEARARADLERLAELFGPQHLFVELQDYGLPNQPELNAVGRRLARELGLKTVVTNDCRYEKPEDAVTLDLLNCIARTAGVDDPARKGLPTDQQFFKTEAQMRELFPDDGPALDRTVDIAARCHFKFKTDTYYFPATTPPDAGPSLEELKAGAEDVDTDANWSYFYKAFPPPRDYGMPDPLVAVPPRPPGAGSINGYFGWYSRIGLELRLDPRFGIDPALYPAYKDRLEFELKVIVAMGFPAYLLIVAEFINWAKDNGIPVGPGRGSAAGSAVAWAMRITDIDPIRFDLLFERFLNPERVSMPDIDVDFCQDRREEVISHVREKYGYDLVSQIITYGKLQAKAALKDVARVCGVEFHQSDRIAKLVPLELNITLEKALQEERFKNIAEGDPLVGRVVTYAKLVEGMNRQTGVHAAGVVIADRPLVQHAPLYRDGPEGGPVVQYDMKSAESVGLIKFDFLGLKTLDQIRDALVMIERNTGEKIEMALVPYEDTATFQLLQKGDALGVFQVESSGMRDLLTRLKPTNIDDLIALLALYRPGPLSSGMVDSFIDCKHGRKPITYPHPTLEPILKSTYGSIVYQEQVMQVARTLSGYSLGEADLLRRAMGKKKAEEMAKQKSRFVDGAVAQGHDGKKADEIFELLAFFAGYGFNKSHSAAYGVVSYHTAWLKAHHRAEYMAALMSIDAGNTDKILIYIGDCKRAGIDVLPPDVNESQLGFDVPKGDRRRIRFGMAAVKGVGESAVEAILEAREAGGRFSSFMDLLERVDPKRINKKVMESLIKCGAFDWTGQPRRRLLEGLEAAMGVAQRIQEQRASGQTNLFGRMGPAVINRVQLPDVGEWPLAVKLSNEREALGFFITGHPVEAFKPIIKRVATCPIDQLDRQNADAEVKVAGMVTALRQIKTKKGDKMAFVTLEDVHSSVECIFFSEAWALSQRALEAEQPVLVSGSLERASAESGPKIMAESAELLADLRERRTREVHLRLEAEDLGDGRSELLVKLLEASKGRIPVLLHLRLPERAWASLRLGSAFTVTPDEPLLQGLETLFRRPDVVELA
jgi:DNA polymerase-3 subunit alpha